MLRAIVGFHRDDEGEWVAELDCGHTQHLRHRPPWVLRPWVLETAQRETRLGTPLACKRCDRAELPEGLVLLERTAITTDAAALQRPHRTPVGVWSAIRVSRGRLECALGASLERTQQLHAGDTCIVPPDVEHRLRAVGEVEFVLERWRTAR